MAKYLKLDSELGYIEDPVSIKYTKFNNLRHTLLGFMMGDFDDKGRYVIEPEIVRELISMKKHIIEVNDNIEICHGEIRLDKPFTFVITYEGERVTLSLLEKMNFEANYKLDSGAYSNINEYILDEIETSGIVDRTLVYKQWNVDAFGGQELDIFNCDEALLEKYFGIVNRFKYLIKANTLLIEKEDDLEEIEAEYANRIMDLLVQFPNLKKVVVEEINKSITEKKDFICADKLFFAKTINEVLDKAVGENLSTLTEEEQAKFNESKNIITRDINIKREEILDIESTNVDAKENGVEEITKVDRIDTKGEDKITSLQELAEGYAHIVSEQEKGQAEDIDKDRYPETADLTDTIIEIVGEDNVYSSDGKRNLLEQSADRVAAAKAEDDKSTNNTNDDAKNKGTKKSSSLGVVFDMVGSYVAKPPKAKSGGKTGGNTSAKNTKGTNANATGQVKKGLGGYHGGQDKEPEPAWDEKLTEEEKAYSTEMAARVKESLKSVGNVFDNVNDSKENIGVVGDVHTSVDDTNSVTHAISNTTDGGLNDTI